MLDMEMVKETGILLLLFGNAWKDLRKKEISLFLVAVMMAWGLLETAGQERGWMQLACGLGAGAAAGALSLAAGGAVGMGDAFLLAALGLLLTPERFLTVTFLGLLLAGIYSLVLLTIKRKRRDTEIAFVPFLLAAYVGGLCL